MDMNAKCEPTLPNGATCMIHKCCWSQESKVCENVLLYKKAKTLNPLELRFARPDGQPLEVDDVIRGLQEFREKDPANGKRRLRTVSVDREDGERVYGRTWYMELLPDTDSVIIV